MSKKANTRRKLPPKEHRFRKGQSGNPRGRPKAKKKRQAKSVSAFDIVIDKTLTVMRGGEPREVTLEEALQHQTYQQAIAGSRMAQREVLKMIVKREKYLDARDNRAAPSVEIRRENDPANADEALLILGIACRDLKRKDFKFEGEPLLLEPWAVQAALSRRRGGTALSERDVADIKRCTRDADTLRWPRGTNA